MNRWMNGNINGRNDGWMKRWNGLDRWNGWMDR